MHITAADACEYFKREGIPIGQSTVYRRLECLVDEGLVKKYIIDGTSPACFEYVGEVPDSGCEACFHFKCEKCGQIRRNKAAEDDNMDLIINLSVKK